MRVNKFRQERKRRMIRICIMSLLGFGAGCYMLFIISPSFKPILGNTFYIVMGCVLIAVSGLVLLVTLKNFFFPKKKRSRSNVVFLEDELKKMNEQKH
jgi:hypothetical protein